MSVPVSIRPAVLSAAEHRPEAAARALHALSGGITGYMYSSVNPAERRQAVIQMSFLLRNAFSVQADELDFLPLQLGADFEAAHRFMAEQARLWARGSARDELFRVVQIGDAQSEALRRFLPSLIPLDAAAIWLAREFGHIRAAREAEHCRRYVAVWMTRAIVGETGRPEPVGRPGADALQTRLDGWSNPVAGIETSLHFERTIQPMLRRIAEIAKAAAPAGPLTAANDPGPL